MREGGDESPPINGDDDGRRRHSVSHTEYKSLNRLTALCNRQQPQTGGTEGLNAWLKTWTGVGE